MYLLTKYKTFHTYSDRLTLEGKALLVTTAALVSPYYGWSISKLDGAP